MSSIAIGEQLKTARETRGLSIDHVADDTNIAKRYIVAMEKEDFSLFPGEPYTIGFLRNYAEYLGLDPKAVIQAFKSIGIQEQPLPIQELLKPKKMPKWPFIAASGLVAAVLCVFVVLRLTNAEPAAGGQTSPETKEPVQLAMDKAVLEKRFYEGDTLLVPCGNDTYKLKIGTIDDRVAVETPIGTTRFMLGEEGVIDLDKDTQPELSVFIVDFQKNDASKGAVIRFTAAGALAQNLPPVPGAPVAEQKPPETAGAETAAQTTPLETPTAQPERPASQETVVFSGKRSPHPFVVNATFRNYAMFRTEIDRKEREERYYHKSDQMTVTANNQAKLWASNAAACKLTIQASGGQSVDVDLGLPGEVVVKLLKWVQSDDGMWSLCVYNVN